MKWENRDILMQANIRKFSKLEYIGTPLRFFDSLFENALVDMIFGYTRESRH